MVNGERILSCNGSRMIHHVIDFYGNLHSPRSHLGHTGNDRNGHIVTFYFLLQNNASSIKSLSVTDQPNSFTWMISISRPITWTDWIVKWYHNEIPFHFTWRNAWEIFHKKIFRCIWFEYTILSGPATTDAIARSIRSQPMLINSNNLQLSPAFLD